MNTRQRREPSGLFSLFQPAQIQQFKEAFQLIDNDKDGWITHADLRQIFSSLGMSPSEAILDDLLAARPGLAADTGINFTMFLTMMSERLVQFDPEADLSEAFECFDETDAGTVKVDELRKWMSDVGERMDHQEIDKFFNSSFTDRHGNFNYREWIKVLRINDDADEPEHAS
ncbi:hypothetical protein L210DRAFT_3392307 [Boletus edulis BED1]|uniref:EF-hand domain-containing protein n=1 Tax=Boletus edulis BED1 TaxID=1328754 RepID=A0AAD4C121_BOLED|nr:hypothetical protein L210DRAFT_3392307 [Boletus edulis BED1]